MAEFVDVVDELADPSDEGKPAFHVVVPSLPGFGYSGKPATTGWGIGKIAAAWAQLTDRLGYRELLAHGGDWGGVITTVLGGTLPERVLGIHTTVAQAPPGLATDGLTAAERRWGRRAIPVAREDREVHPASGDCGRPEEERMSDKEVPEPVDSFIAAVNAHDENGFLDAFTADGAVDDWGRLFTGRRQIKAWSDKEFIGAGGTLSVEEVDASGSTITVIGDWRSNHANGRSRFVFDIDGDRLAKMTIREG